MYNFLNKKIVRRLEMQIGEFAKLCGTKITVLRHYDKEGLLEPDYVDAFTGYRYYSDEQIPVFFRITALKKAGFSLVEIKKILASGQTNESLLGLFEQKQAELARMTADLDEARKIVTCEKKDFDVIFTEKEGAWEAQSTVFGAHDERKARELMERTICAKKYQRISSYETRSIPNSNYAYLVCLVVKLNMNAMNVYEHFQLPFENDERIIGKWALLGEYAVKSDFYEGFPKGGRMISDTLKTLYFLPEGKRCWCYAWTKGKLLWLSDGDSTVNPYTIEMYENAVYMFVEMKSFEYRYGGRPTVLVLRQIDRKAYTAEDIRRKDDVDLPFVPDPSVMGSWRVYDCVRTKEHFDPAHPTMEPFALHTLDFSEDGTAVLIRSSLEKRNAHKEPCRWTAGVVIRGGIVACAYEIQRIEGKEYLFMEWKNGDYVYGGCEPWCYVFVKE